MEVWNVKGKLLKGVLSFGIGLGVLYGGSSAQADTSTIKQYFESDDA